MIDDDLLKPFLTTKRSTARQRRARRKAKRIVVGPHPGKGATEEELVEYRKRVRARERQRAALKSAKTRRESKKTVRQLLGKQAPVTISTRMKQSANAKRQHAEGRAGRRTLPKERRRTEALQYRATAFQLSVIDARMARADAAIPRRAGSWLREVALGYESAWPAVRDVVLPEAWATQQARSMEYREGGVIRVMVSLAEKRELRARAYAEGYKALGAYVRDIHMGRDREHTTSLSPLKTPKSRERKLVVAANFVPREFVRGIMEHR
tara:strand:- start:4542 stop:5342 length:801 start_codon:yes stop_codon:yes gene_type:complete